MTGSLTPDPAEVAATDWLTWPECVELSHRPEASPWFHEQMVELRALGDPLDWPAASAEALPPALSW
jgi:isopentenyldiphosphate isomerase